MNTIQTHQQLPAVAVVRILRPMKCTLYSFTRTLVCSRDMNTVSTGSSTVHPHLNLPAVAAVRVLCPVLWALPSLNFCFRLWLWYEYCVQWYEDWLVTRHGCDCSVCSLIREGGGAYLPHPPPQDHQASTPANLLSTTPPNIGSSS